METRKSRINEHQEAVDELDLSIERQKGELGRVVLDKDKPQEESIQAAWEHALETKENLSHLEEQRKTLKEVLDGKIDATDRIEEIERERREERKAREDLLLEIGRKGWDLYEFGSLSGDEYKTFFSELLEISGEIEERERKIRDLEAEREQSSFVRKISLSAKISMLKNQIGKLRRDMEGSFATAGDALVSSGKVEEIPDEELKRFISRLKDLNEKESETEAEIERLRTDISDYEKKMADISGDISAEKKLRNMETELSSLQEDHFGRLQKLGDVFYAQSENMDKVEEETEVILNRLKDLEAQKHKHQNEINTLQAEIEKDQLEEEIKKKEDSISKLEKKIKEHKDEIKSLKDTITKDKNKLLELGKTISGDKEESD
ncbi:MAG: hypothetical protein ACLFNZ_07000 [Spirochaetaceae bacterium]